MPQLDRLGLRENPFNKNIDQRFFYADKNRAQILESTEHLIEYSSNFQVILGEPGIGKSHLLETLANRIDNNWRVAKITIAGQYNTQSLIQTILDSFGAIEDDRIELLEALETQLAEINQLGFKPVLFVDDAQALPVDCLRFLMQLSQQKQDEVPYINIVLFATTQVTEFLQSPELKGFRDIIHIATLNRLDKESLSAYLRHKMAVAGFDRETPFTPRIIDSIFSDSDGIPEKVDFFADKFLTSSGKADNYIEPDNQQDDLHTGQETNLMDSFNDDDLAEDRNDRAEVQLSRLTEKFEEIEQLGEQQEDEPFTEGDSDYNEEFQTEDELSDSGLAKFVIPVALIGIIIVALLVMNSVFEQSEQSSVQGEKEQIDLLPLELPPENLVVNKGVVKKRLVEEKPATQPELEITQPSESLKEENSETITKIAVDSPETKQETLQAEKPVVIEQVASPVIKPIVDETPKPVVPMIAAPELSSVEPEPVIGSNTRQYITITGKNLEKDTLLLVSWPGNKKEFSEKQTPGQWQYVSKNKIKLHLNTSIASQQWTVSAKSAESIQSPVISFDVVKPFISQLSIKKVLPNPFIGSDKRQAVTIEGDGFSKRTVIELRWDKNKKHFSSRLTPGQFEFISSKRIKLFIATGIKKRKWTVVAISPTGKSSTSSFLVTDKSLDEKKIAKVNSKKVNSNKVNSNEAIKDENWLRQQVDTNYTIQLFGSHNKSAIGELVKKYALTGDVLRYKTQRNGQNWYTMTYGSYLSKNLAEAAIMTLNPALTKTPWVRNFASIKDQLSEPLVQTSVTAAGQKEKQGITPAPETAKPDKPEPGSAQKATSGNAAAKTKGEAWIWTQNPADYTIQLIALSTEAGIKDYMKKNVIESKSAYFKRVRDGKTLYVLIYGSYEDKSSAQQAAKQLSIKINNSQPWIRNFSAVHGMMSSR